MSDAEQQQRSGIAVPEVRRDGRDATTSEVVRVFDRAIDIFRWRHWGFVVGFVLGAFIATMLGIYMLDVLIALVEDRSNQCSTVCPGVLENVSETQSEPEPVPEDQP